jgi:hypothetical protein
MQGKFKSESYFQKIEWERYVRAEKLLQQI